MARAPMALLTLSASTGQTSSSSSSVVIDQSDDADPRDLPLGSEAQPLGEETTAFARHADRMADAACRRTT